MTSQINAQLARVFVDARLQSAQHHRATRTYSMPVRTVCR